MLKYDNLWQRKICLQQNKQRKQQQKELYRGYFILYITPFITFDWQVAKADSYMLPFTSSNQNTEHLDHFSCISTICSTFI